MEKRYHVHADKIYCFEFDVIAKSEEDAEIIAYSIMNEPDVDALIPNEPDDGDLKVDLYVELLDELDESEAKELEDKVWDGLDRIFSIKDLKMDAELDDYEWAKDQLQKWRIAKSREDWVCQIKAEAVEEYLKDQDGLAMDNLKKYWMEKGYAEGFLEANRLFVEAQAKDEK